MAVNLDKNSYVEPFVDDDGEIYPQGYNPQQAQDNTEYSISGETLSNKQSANNSTYYENKNQYNGSFKNFVVEQPQNRYLYDTSYIEEKHRPSRVAGRGTVTTSQQNVTRKKWKINPLVAVAIILTCFVCQIAFFAVNNYINQSDDVVVDAEDSLYDTYDYRCVEMAVGDVNKIVVSDFGANIYIYGTDEEYATVYCPEAENEEVYSRGYRTQKSSDGTFFISRDEEVIREIGLDVTLYVPYDYTGTLEINNNRGTIHINDMVLNDAVEINGDNSEIYLSYCSFDSCTVIAEEDNKEDSKDLRLNEVKVNQNLNIETENKHIYICDSKLCGNADISTTYGDIYFIDSSIENASISNVGGAISGSLFGDESDYKITVECINGSNRLNSSQTGKYNLDISDDYGDILLDFEGVEPSLGE